MIFFNFFRFLISPVDIQFSDFIMALLSILIYPLRIWTSHIKIMRGFRISIIFIYAMIYCLHEKYNSIHQSNSSNQHSRRLCPTKVITYILLTVKKIKKRKTTTYIECVLVCAFLFWWIYVKLQMVNGWTCLFFFSIVFKKKKKKNKSTHILK